MGKNTRNLLKTYFQTGDIPSEGQYINLIESTLNLKDEGIEQLNSSISASSFISNTHITASGDISSSANLLGKQLGIGTIPSTSASFNTNGRDVDIHVSASYPRVWIEAITGSASVTISANNPTIAFAKTIWTGSSDLSGDNSASYLEWRLQSHNSALTHRGQGGFPFSIKKVNKFGEKESVFNLYSQSRQDTLNLSGSVTQYTIGGTNPATIGSTFKIDRYGADIVNGIISMFGSASGDSKVGIGYKTPTSRLHVSGAIHAAGYGSGSQGNITADLTGSFGYITSSGEIAVDTLKLGGTTITASPTQINHLNGVLSSVGNAYDTITYNTSTGVLQITPLNNVLQITDTMDLGIGTGDSPNFVALTLTGKDDSAPEYTWDNNATINSACFSRTTAAPALLAKVRTRNQIITNNTVLASSIILANCSLEVNVLIHSVVAGSFKFQLENNAYGNASFAGGLARINFTIL